jgi:hypothetical protein
MLVLSFPPTTADGAAADVSDAVDLTAIEHVIMSAQREANIGVLQKKFP